MQVKLNVLLKTGVNILIKVLFISSLPVQAVVNAKVINHEQQSDTSSAHHKWLKQRFSVQHERLIPIVAVADMFFSCNQERNIDIDTYRLIDLISVMDKNTLAEKLILCLGNDSIQSDIAINFGLLGCFHQQLSYLDNIAREKKLIEVRQAMELLSSEERKKTFSRCTTEQAIHYLQ